MPETTSNRVGHGSLPVKAKGRTHTHGRAKGSRRERAEEKRAEERGRGRRARGREPLWGRAGTATKKDIELSIVLRSQPQHRTKVVGHPEHRTKEVGTTKALGKEDQVARVASMAKEDGAKAQVKEEKGKALMALSQLSRPRTGGTHNGSQVTMRTSVIVHP